MKQGYKTSISKEVATIDRVVVLTSKECNVRNNMISSSKTQWHSM